MAYSEHMHRENSDEINSDQMAGKQTAYSKHNSNEMISDSKRLERTATGPDHW